MLTLLLPMMACNLNDDVNFPADGEPCERAGQRRGELICREGQWQAQGDTSNQTSGPCTPEADDALCVQANLACGTHTLTDACGVRRTIACDSPCETGQSCQPVDGRCVTCQPETDAALCEAAGRACGMLAHTNACGDQVMISCDMKILACEEDTTCDPESGACVCDTPACPDDAVCGVASNACGNETDCGGGCQDALESCIAHQCIIPELSHEGANRLGYALAADGDWIAATLASATDRATITSDSVGLYQRDPATGAWRLAQTLMAPPSQTPGLFGASLAMRGDMLVVGEPQRVDAQALKGGAHVFKRDEQGQWLFMRTLTHEEGRLTFGLSVALHEHTFVVGDPGIDFIITGRENFGAAIIFDCHADLSICATSKLNDSQNNDLFGASLALDGERLFIGAPNRSTTDLSGTRIRHGAVVAYGRAQTRAFTRQAVMTLDPQAAWRLGSALSLSAAGLLAIGAPQSSEDVGRTYIIPIERIPSGSDTILSLEEHGARLTLPRLLNSEPLWLGMGQSVAWHEDRVIAGTPHTREDLTPRDAAGGFLIGVEQPLGSYSATTRRLGPRPGAKLGQAIAVAGDTLAASASADGRVMLFQLR